MHRAAPEFWAHFALLPEAVQRTAARNYERLKEDLSYPSLRFKKVGDYWAVRVGRSYRTLAVEDGDDFVWVWIGEHDEYERIVRAGR